MKLPLSVFIIAKNEEDRITHTINSVSKWVDEVIVVDSGSTDNTVALSKSLGAKAHFHEWRGYGIQKRYGESLCKNDWILNLDADEAVSPELCDNIIELFKSGDTDNYPAYRMKWVLVKPGEDKYTKFGPGASFIRLYNRKFASFSDSSVHDSVILKNKNVKVKTLEGVVLHRCFRSYQHMVEKINFYSAMQAEDLYKRGKRFSVLRTVIEPFSAFFKAYFLRRYFMWGVDGVIEATIYAFARTLRIAKLREMYRKENN